MREKLATILSEGKINSLGRTAEVVGIVLQNPQRLEELWQCMFESDQWVRMRAGDALEKVCRNQPDWFKPYIPRLFSEMAKINQPSIQWHLAQILGEVELSETQQAIANDLLCDNIATIDVDWIVAANSMITLVQFAKVKKIDSRRVIKLLNTQQHHRSNAVAKKAGRLLAEVSK